MFKKIHIIIPFLPPRHIYIIIYIQFFINDSSKPKPLIEETIKRIHPPNLKEEYFRYRIPPFPDQNAYEIIEEDFQFLKSFNSKSKSTEITVEDFEQYLSVLDLKSGKDVIIDLLTFQNTVQQSNIELPSAITNLPQNLQLELYGYWKKYREHLQRPLVRSLQHPYLEETNPHLAFRPRQAPNDRTMKLRRGGMVQQVRGLAEMDQTSQKVISLKEDMNRAQQLLEMCLNREKAMEIDRRGTFCKFVKKVQEDFKSQPTDQAHELKIWLKGCFVKDSEKCSINITRIDEMIEIVSKDMQQWREDQERIRKDYEKKDEQIKKIDNSIKNISAQHHTAISSQQQVVYESEYAQYTEPQVRVSRKKMPIDEIVNPKDIMSREYTEEKRESIAKFMSTLYLEARKFNLTLDKVVQQTAKLSTFTPQNKEIPKQGLAQQIITQSLTAPSIEPQQAPLRKNIIPFQLVQIPGNDLIYRLPLNHDLIPKLKWGSESQETQWHQQSDTQQDQLYKSFDYFKSRTRSILQLADLDQMLFSQGGEEDKHEEEELKVLRKKLKLSQNKGQINGIIKA